ncbi:MAG: M23 family metallopeptidase [Akkermansiaceae bacterium]
MLAVFRTLIISAVTCAGNLVTAQTSTTGNQHKTILPTDNKHLFSGEGEKFYMYVYRSFEGKKSRPWTAGKYGFVRNIKRTEDGVIGTRFHEGIDIKPLERDRANKPLDKIKAIASGTVAYANSTSSRSNYGKYVVIEHLWDCGPIYSLYAHLSAVSVKAGQKIEQGESIGVMGYTGAGLNRERSHLHLELNLLLSEQFAQWHSKYLGGKNYHGVHNGMNMAGLDIAGYYIAQKRNPSLTLPQFVRTQPVYYKVTIPRTTGTKQLGLLKRYPWLAAGSEKNKSPSWEISFTASSFPIAILPSQRTVSAPRITSVRKCKSKHSYHTKGFVNGTGYRASLSDRGKRFISLITGSFIEDNSSESP